MKKRIAKTIGIMQFMDMFPTKEDAIIWYENERWNGSPVCVRCGEAESIRVNDKTHKHYCNKCRRSFTVKMGTVMEASNIDIRYWLYAMYCVVTGRKGISSLQLSKELNTTQKTAWFMLHRIRELCITDLSKLCDVVEVDETYVGGKEGNKRVSKRLKAGRGAVGKQPVLGMRQRGGKVKAMPVPNTTSQVLQGEIVDNVEFGSDVYTDDHRSYIGLNKLPYYHGVVKHSLGEFVNGDVHTNGIESVWAVLKRSLHGTWHNVSRKHLHRYVNETSFRLNEGNCEVDTMDRMTFMVKSSVGKRLKYKDLIK